jgi:hypothetical protein
MSTHSGGSSNLPWGDREDDDDEMNLFIFIFIFYL